MRILLLLLFPLPLFAQAPPCTAGHYKIVAVPMIPAAINDSGVIAGMTPRHRAATWSEKIGMKEIPVTQGLPIAETAAINNRGEIVGTLSNASSSERKAFLYRDGKMQLLAGGESKGSAINDDGEVAGEAALPTKQVSSAVIWKNGVARDLGGCCGGTAIALNNRGQAAGQAYDDQGRYHAFLWDKDHGLQTIAPTAFTTAVTMNDAGTVVVQDVASHKVFLYAGGTLNAITLSPKAPTRPRAMNHCGAIVGSFGAFADIERAFVWDSAQGFRDLNDLIPATSGWKLEAATGINGKGEIVGWGDYKHQDDTGFLLVPEP